MFQPSAAKNCKLKERIRLVGVWWLSGSSSECQLWTQSMSSVMAPLLIAFPNEIRDKGDDPLVFHRVAKVAES